MIGLIKPVISLRGLCREKERLCFTVFLLNGREKELS